MKFHTDIYVQGSYGVGVCPSMHFSSESRFKKGKDMYSHKLFDSLKAVIIPFNTAQRSQSPDNTTYSVFSLLFFPHRREHITPHTLTLLKHHAGHTSMINVMAQPSVTKLCGRGHGCVHAHVPPVAWPAALGGSSNVQVHCTQMGICIQELSTLRQAAQCWGW